MPDSSRDGMHAQALGARASRHERRTSERPYACRAADIAAEVFSPTLRELEVVLGEQGPQLTDPPAQALGAVACRPVLGVLGGAMAGGAHGEGVLPGGQGRAQRGAGLLELLEEVFGHWRSDPAGGEGA